GNTKTVSDRLNSLAICCIRPAGMPCASVTTAAGFPASGVSVKTSTTTYRYIANKLFPHVAGVKRRPGTPVRGAVPAKAAGWRKLRHSPDAVRQALRRVLVMRGQTLRPGEDQEGYEVSTVMYAGYGAEIEDDAVRLRRRKLEFDDDAA